MLRYKTETRPGLVALYDIRPGNGAGQFLEPRSPHRASCHPTNSVKDGREKNSKPFRILVQQETVGGGWCKLECM